uniref:Ribosomal protein S12 n=1 Tax=Goodyera procera TaxID=798536 RepID=A0A0X9RAZ9_9ASPA|nr:ribosomal protein S12 [Goodyera procera]YP_009231773.1 ribosomal protein S12 [Goodyera procera]AMA07077.1 ribosomal protein S12 [Goodyera procera]AMA07078.1 ribosomal protein S12 [Goodyera procera]
MPTIKQLIRNARQPIRNVTKSPALRGCPQRRGTCTRVYFTRTFCSLSKRRKGSGLTRCEIEHCSRNPRCCRSKDRQQGRSSAL